MCSLDRAGRDCLQAGAAFDEMPDGQPENALDGDDSIVALRRLQRRRVTSTSGGVRQTSGSSECLRARSVDIDTVTLTAGGTTRVVRLPDSGVAVADLGGVVTGALDLRVDGTRGEDLARRRR